MAGVTMRITIGLLAAGVLAQATLTLSSAVPVPAGLLPLIGAADLGGELLLGIQSVTIESDAAFAARAKTELPARVRLIAGPESTAAADLAAAVEGSPDVAIWSGPVTSAGRIEVLPFLHEQAVSITAHRFGNPDRGMIGLTL